MFIMKKFFKIAISAILAALMLASLAACGGSVPTPSDPPVSNAEQAARRDDSKTSDASKNTDKSTDSKAVAAKISIGSEEFFESDGYQIVLANSSTKVTVTVDDAAKDVEFAVYVLDEKFSDSMRYISQSNEPVLNGAGSIDVKAGQYLYVYCSVNALTADAPLEGASITLMGHGLTR